MNYHNILHDDMRNGDGLRVTLFVSGCAHYCNNCQNPQTWDCNSGIEFDLAAKEEIFEQLNNEYISGITFTGGDPLHENNLNDVLDLIYEINKRYPNKTIWLYTGYIIDIFEEYNSDHAEIRVYPLSENFNFNVKRANIIMRCDVVVDGKYEEDKRDVSLHWRGSSNQRLIDIKKSLNEGEIVLWDMF